MTPATLRRWIVLLALAVFGAGCTTGTAIGPEPEATGQLADIASVEPAPEPAVAASIFVRDRDGLSAEDLTALETWPGVVAMTTSRSEQLGLHRTADADGTPLLDLPDDYIVPVQVRAVDDVGAAALRDGVADDADLLVPGTTILTPTGAAFRRVGVGGTVHLRAIDRTEVVLRVIGIAPDPVSADTEFLVHETDAETLQFDPIENVVLTPDPSLTDADVVAIAQEIADGIEDGFTRVLLGDGPTRSGRLVLSLAATKRTFGEFAFQDRAGVREITMGVTWERANIVRDEVPVLGRVRCHRAIIDDLRQVFTDIEAAGLAGEIDRSRYQGCYYARRIGTSGNLSKHAWGIAVDINVDVSIPGGGEVPHPDVIEAFERNGFRWGGDFPNPDNHHFEWIGIDATSDIAFND